MTDIVLFFYPYSGAAVLTWLGLRWFEGEPAWNGDPSRILLAAVWPYTLIALAYCWWIERCARWME